MLLVMANVRQLVSFPTKCHFNPLQVLGRAIFQFPHSVSTLRHFLPEIIIKTRTNSTETRRSRWMHILDMENTPPLIPFAKSPELQGMAIRFRDNVHLWMRTWGFLSACILIFLPLQRYRKPEMCFTM